MRRNKTIGKGISKYPNKIVKYEDYAELIITSPKYGIFKLKIDLDDVERVSKYQWSINKTGRPPYKDITFRFYASNMQVGLLHRFLMNNPKGLMVDHRSRDELDNRKANLRACTRSQNLMNRDFMINNKSGCVGVRWDEPTSKWCAYIKVNQRFKSLGYYSDINDAIKARKQGEQKYFGEYASDYTRNLA